ncbi:hypothetical protein H0G86_005936 [Trichoderma simmonsii]|uniref:Uncharacterized protein n=1 Tax=Trichoderma simmonsii TaxID=1491479 RepID=A0A8G0LDK0_9HYPO|nr:hypothetical protein H0G86_005936 [Trichoderma simmonsii]
MSPFSHPVLRMHHDPQSASTTKKNAPCTKNTSIHATSKSSGHIKTRPVKTEKKNRPPVARLSQRDETRRAPALASLFPQSSPFCAGQMVVTARLVSVVLSS